MLRLPIRGYRGDDDAEVRNKIAPASVWSLKCIRLLKKCKAVPAVTIGQQRLHPPGSFFFFAFVRSSNKNIVFLSSNKVKSRANIGSQT